MFEDVEDVNILPPVMTILLLNLENDEKGPSLGHRKRRLDLRNAATSEQLVPMLEFVLRCSSRTITLTSCPSTCQLMGVFETVERFSPTVVAQRAPVDGM